MLAFVEPTKPRQRTISGGLDEQQVSALSRDERSSTT